MIDADSDDDSFRLDTSWWVKIFQLKDKNGSAAFGLLSKLVKALLSIFSGPIIIEGTFTIMNDIVEEDRTRLTQFNYEALAMTKSFLDTRDMDSVDMDITRSMLKKVAGSYSCYQRYLQENSYSKHPSTATTKSTSSTTPQSTGIQSTATTKSATNSTPQSTATKSTTTTSPQSTGIHVYPNQLVPQNLLLPHC